jgi:hypothetical protein
MWNKIEVQIPPSHMAVLYRRRRHLCSTLSDIDRYSVYRLTWPLFAKTDFILSLLMDRSHEVLSLRHREPDWIANVTGGLSLISCM